MTDESKPKIFIYRPTSQTVDCGGVAFAEDGTELEWHVSSSLSWFRSDMGLNGPFGIGKSKHRTYEQKYPDGYELVEVVGKEAMQKLIDSGQIKNLTFEQSEEQS